jgi:membrane protein
MKLAWRVLGSAAMKFIEHDAFTLAAALAFYTLLSLAPLIVFLVGALGAFSSSSQQLVVSNFQSALGPRAGEVARAVLENAEHNRHLSTLSSVISAIALFIAAAGMFTQLQSGLNRIWEVRLRPGFRVREWLTRRGITFVMVLVLGAILLGSLVLSSLARIFLPEATPLMAMIRYVGGIALFTVLFALLYKLLPDTVIEWRDVWVGGLATAVLVSLGRLALGLYLRHSVVASAYGAAGSLVALLIVFYYSAAMVYFGAEATRVWARLTGHPIRPRTYAEWVQAQPPAPLPT